MNFFLPIDFNICFGCSKEPSHRDGSFEYPQHMFWLRNKKNNSLRGFDIIVCGKGSRFMRKAKTIDVKRGKRVNTVCYK